MKKKIKAWAIIGEDNFLLVQNRPTMDCQVYCDPQGKVKPREYLSIVPCEIKLLPPKTKNTKETSRLELVLADRPN